MSDADARRILAAYERAPYPSQEALRAGAGSPSVPTHWVNAVAWPGQAMHAQARILVAGCGTGHEAARLAVEHPEAEIVAVDFSTQSIAVAERMKAEGWPERIRFEVADLTCDELDGPFDFISCNAVADYVPDSGALLSNLAGALAPTGVLYLGVNSPTHPARRLATALEHLGTRSDVFQDSEAQRSALRLAATIMGDDGKIPGFAHASGSYLSVEMFPAFAHHRSLEDWLVHTTAAGLHLRGTLNTPFALAGIGDRDLPQLYRFDRGGVSRLVEGLRFNHMLPMLLTTCAPEEPPWSDVGQLQTWKPRSHPCIGPERIRPLEGDWMTQRFLALQSPGLPELRLNLSAYMLEIYRCADGTRTLAELRAALGPRAPDDHVRAALFRGYHASVLYMAR